MLIKILCTSHLSAHFGFLEQEAVLRAEIPSDLSLLLLDDVALVPLLNLCMCLSST